MLGCQDFCGYYDWTFHYLRRRWGQQAVADLWAEAIGGESQAHYLRAALDDGLRGLLRTWNKTGEDEHCDWTFTLDEGRNVLRWDMRRCPSKGFLLNNDLHADEDYCDHCMGWIVPLLEKAGIEVAVHEHNHCGQCWAELKVKGKPYQSLEEHGGNIRHDPRWLNGFVDRWEGGAKRPPLPGVTESVDPCDILEAWFGPIEDLAVLGRGPSAARFDQSASPRNVLVTAATYASRDVFAGDPPGVLIGDRPPVELLEAIAQRLSQTPAERRPLLMYAYLPQELAMAPAAFVGHGLPRPVPILPLLIRRGLYRHEPAARYPTTGVFAVLLAVALGKNVDVAGIDLYRHPSGRTYAGGHEGQRAGFPDRHSYACDLAHLRRAASHAAAAGKRLQMPAFIREQLDQPQP